MNKLRMNLLKPIDLAGEALAKLFVRGFEMGPSTADAEPASDRSRFGAELSDLSTGYGMKATYLYNTDPIFEGSRF